MYVFYTEYIQLITPTRNNSRYTLFIMYNNKDTSYQRCRTACTKWLHTYLLQQNRIKNFHLPLFIKLSLYY